MMHDLRSLAGEADGAPCSAVLIGADRNAVLARDAQTAQNVPTSGNPADSETFINSLVRSPVTGCTSILDQARIESGFNPLTPDLADNPTALFQYLDRIANREPLFVVPPPTVISVRLRDDDWNQVIDDAISMYPVQASEGLQEVRSSILSVIGAAADAAKVSVRTAMVSQHTIDVGSNVAVYICLSSVSFEKNEDGKETTSQLDFTLALLIFNFQLNLWDEESARAVASQHYKSSLDWLAGMNTPAAGASARLKCLSRKLL